MIGYSAEAIEYHRLAISADANYHRAAHYSLAASLHMESRVDEVLASYADAIRIKPDYAEAYYNRSFVHLGQGNLSAGWQDYEWRLQCKACTRSVRSVCCGGRLAAERTNALGSLGARARRHVALCPIYPHGGKTRWNRSFAGRDSPLVPLLKASGFTGVIAAGSPLPAFDVVAPMMSLPGILAQRLLPSSTAPL